MHIKMVSTWSGEFLTSLELFFPPDLDTPSRFIKQTEWIKDHPDEFRGWAIPQTQQGAEVTFGICYFQLLAQAAQTEDGVPAKNPLSALMNLN